MGIITASGLGSGININELVTQLVNAEGQPAFNAIQRQQDAANTRLSALGTLKSALSDFQSVIDKLKDGNLFKTHKSSSSDESVLQVAAGAGSVAGTYGIEVQNLAKAQKSLSTFEFADAFASGVDGVGSGSLNFSSASGASFSLTIDSSNNSLSSIRDAINSAEGNNFVTASIINVDGTGANAGQTISKLVLTAKDSGTANAFTVTGVDDDGVDDNAGLSSLFSSQLFEQTPPEDAVIVVDGQTATRSTNSITDVIPGLTLDLQAEKPGTTLDITVSLDNEAVKETISEFVTAYNKLHGVTKNLGKYGGSTDGSGTGNGALLGDATLRYIASQVRQNATGTVSSASSDYNSLAMIGISIDKDGVMSLDSAQLEKALSANLQSVSDVFTSSDGVATRLDERLTNFLQSGGALDSQQSSLRNRLSDLEDRKANVQLRLDNLQKSLQKQFIAMDVAVGQFNSTGSFLANWISGLNRSS